MGWVVDFGGGRLSISFVYEDLLVFEGSAMVLVLILLFYTTTNEELFLFAFRQLVVSSMQSTLHHSSHSSLTQKILSSPN